MSPKDHINIIRSISYRKCRFIWETLSNHTDYIGFLFRTNSASDDNISILAQLHKVSSKLFVFLYDRQSFTFNNNSIVSYFKTNFLQGISFSNLFNNFFGFLLSQNESVHLIIKQLAGSAYVHSCLNFVTRQYPHLDSNRLNIRNSLANFILQTVLNSCWPYKFKINLNLFWKLVNNLLFSFRQQQSSLELFAPSFIKIFFNILVGNKECSQTLLSIFIKIFFGFC